MVTKVEAVNRKMDDDKSEAETKLEEYARLLDIRAARIRKLEAQLRDVAYGTRLYRPPLDDDERSEVESVMSETIELEHGMNVFEVHIKRVALSAEAIKFLNDQEPSVFCTYEFFEFEIQSTPVLKGPKAEYQFTSQYTVRVDDFLLHYLQRDACVLELHQSVGTDYQTLAACQLKMKEIVDKNSGRLHGTAQLTGTTEGAEGINFGTVEYWVRLRVPMAQALRLYKERTKALGYLGSNVRLAEQALEVMDENASLRSPDGINELHVKIGRCERLVPRRADVQPSPFCVYKFFDFDDHDTTIVPGSNNPQFNDFKVFPVPMNADLDKYLKTKMMSVFVFDDADPETSLYLGVAKVALLPLAHDKPIKGEFELKNAEGVTTGSIDVTLAWRYTYLPPKSSTKTDAQKLLASAVSYQQKEESVAFLPGEEEELQQQETMATHERPAYRMTTPAPPSGSPVRTVRSRTGPAAMSTPLVKKRSREREVVSPDVTLVEKDVSVSDSFDHPKVIVSQTMDSIQEDDDSIVSEGSHVTGESEPLSPSDSITPRDMEPESVGGEILGTLEGLTQSREALIPGDTLASQLSAVLDEDDDEGHDDDDDDEDETFNVTRSQTDLENTGHETFENTGKDMIENEPDEEEDVSEIEEEGNEIESTMEQDGHNEMPMSTTEGKGEKKEKKDKKKSKKSSSEGEVNDEEHEKSDKSDDTMFGDEASGEQAEEADGSKNLEMTAETADGEEEEEEIEEEEVDEEEEDSEGIVVPSRTNTPNPNGQNPDSIRVSINHLILDEDSPIVKNEAIRMLFVEYRLLSIPLDQTETPFSLPKTSKPGAPISFNFNRVFRVDFQENYEQRQFLASMLLPDDPDHGRIRFTVVSEPPPENEDGDCEDVAYCYVSIPEILEKGKDIIDQDMPLYLIEDESVEVGVMNLTVECLAALKAVNDEMAAAADDSQ